MRNLDVGGVGMAGPDVGGLSPRAQSDVGGSGARDLNMESLDMTSSSVESSDMTGVHRCRGFRHDRLGSKGAGHRELECWELECGALGHGGLRCRRLRYGRLGCGRQGDWMTDQCSNDNVDNKQLH